MHNQIILLWENPLLLSILRDEDQKVEWSAAIWTYEWHHPKAVREEVQNHLGPRALVCWWKCFHSRFWMAAHRRRDRTTWKQAVQAVQGVQALRRVHDSEMAGAVEKGCHWSHKKENLSDGVGKYTDIERKPTNRKKSERNEEELRGLALETASRNRSLIQASRI